MQPQDGQPKKTDRMVGSEYRVSIDIDVENLVQGLKITYPPGVLAGFQNPVKARAPERRPFRYEPE